MKKALSILTAVCCAGALLSGCSSKDKETYIDIDSNYNVLDSTIAEKIEQESVPLNTVITDYVAHSNRKYMIMPAVMCSTIDDKYFYCYMPIGFSPSDNYGKQVLQCYKVDLQSGKLISMCETPGCMHDENYPDCVNNKYFWLDPTAVGDTLWYGSDMNKLVENKDGKETVLFENNYCTEFEEQLLKDYPNQKYGFDFILDGDGAYIYMFGPSYTYRINRKTMEPEKYIKITDDQHSSKFVYQGKAYVTDMLQELFVIDYETGEVTKLGDKINNVAAYDDVLYYTRYNGGKPILYTANLDGTGEKKLLTDCYMDFFVKDGKVFYHNNSGNYTLHSYDLETGEDKVLYDDFCSCSGMITADHIDRIFAIGEIYKGSSEVSSEDEIGRYAVIVSVRTDGSDLWVREVNGRDI